MKKNSTQQEILLMTGTSFTSRQCCEKDDAANPNRLTEKEKLEEACWNGLLPDMIPEIFKTAVGAKKMYLWQIRETESFLELDLGEFPTEKDKHFSIDPYSFLSIQMHN